MAVLRRQHIVVLSLVMHVVTWAAPAAAQHRVSEDDVKATFLFNFAKYVEWPPTDPGDGNAGAFRLCVVAGAAFVTVVDDVIAGETIDGRPVVRETPENGDGARRCQILFIDADNQRRRSLVSAVHGAPVLTVGNGEDFLALGGVVGFVRDGGRVRFDVNLNEAQQTGLAFSSRMLRVARRVISGGAPR
jgi:hypothetical protein